MSEFPNIKWPKKRLDEVALIIAGQSPSSETYNTEGIGLPFFQGKAEFSEIHPIPVKWCSKPIRIAQPDDILISVRAPVGDVNISNSQCCIGRGLAAIRYPVPKYLFFYLRLIKNLVAQEGTGSTFNAISVDVMKNLLIPFPSQSEQHRIVIKIEELFSELDNGIANLEKAKEQLKVYRQSVLKWAFEGRLTNTDVKEGELPEGWKWVKIKEVATTFSGFAFKSGDFKDKGAYQVIRMGNVRPGIIRYFESSVFVDDPDESILKRSMLMLNDVIITQTGTRKKRDYGFTALIKKSNLLLNQRIAAMRFNDGYLPSFFLYFSWTNVFKDQFFENETGNVGQGNVGMKAVTESLIPFCSLSEQQRIVQEIESRFSLADKMEQTIDESLLQAEALRQSILKSAFEGRLV
ncbi:MAG: restriction endonuclease subunit S [Bacteroidales bacterium]|nr:restriction endonuclease subunit S [Bacteroidales bacterium]